LPGKITDKYSQGCNLIISQNKAKIINKPQDILDELGLNEEKNNIPNLFEPKTIKLNKEVQQFTIVLPKINKFLWMI